LKGVTRGERRSLLEDSRLQGKLRRISAFEINKGETKKTFFVEVKSQWKNLGLFCKIYEEARSGRNSLWEIPEIMRTIGSREVVGWLEVGDLITLGYRINVDH
jgi:hypothetical protein